MNHKVLFALPVLALAACSQDDLLEVNRSVNEITFDVVSGNASKAANVFCNNNKPGEFYVWAKNGANDLMVGDHIVYESSAWVNKSANRFWPETGNVDFYAHVNAGSAFQWNSGAPKIENFTVPTTVAEQTDLLYSVKKDVAKSNSAVTLNFHHALSQIVFDAKNTNEHLHAEVYGVELCMLSDKGTYTYPTASTEANNADHTGAGTVNGGKGTWDYGTTHETVYGVSFTTPVDVVKGTTVSLTSANDAGKEFNSQALMLIPQTTTEWNKSTDPTNGDKGSYILVNCVIRNIAGATVDKANDVVLWGTGSGAAATPKKIAIPAAFNWSEGNKYIYTLVFGEGGGTTPPSGGGGDPAPSPVLVPITFDVTVDDFVNAGNTDVNAGF